MKDKKNLDDYRNEINSFFTELIEKHFIFNINYQTFLFQNLIQIDG